MMNLQRMRLWWSRNVGPQSRKWVFGLCFLSVFFLVLVSRCSNETISEPPGFFTARSVLIIPENRMKVPSSNRIPQEFNECEEYTARVRNPNLEYDKRGPFSQFGQDHVLEQIFRDTKPGYFVDLAAATPKFLSNTFYLETCKGWNGLCIEGDPEKTIPLLRERTCQVAPECITETRTPIVFQTRAKNDLIAGIYGVSEGKSNEHKIKLICEPLQYVLGKYGAPKRIDFLSLDIESAEPGALKSIGDYEVDLVLIELYHLRVIKERNVVVKNWFKENNYIPVIGFPTNKANICSSSEIGNRIWNMDLEVLFSDRFNEEQHRSQTLDVLFIRKDSKYFDHVRSLYSCQSNLRS